MGEAEESGLLKKDLLQESVVIGIEKYASLGKISKNDVTIPRQNSDVL